MEEAESMYLAGADGRLSLVRKKWGLWEAIEPFMRFPSLGHMFSAASEYIFGHFQHAGKTMGLAAFGDAAAFPDPFIEHQGDDLVIDTTWLTMLPPRSSLPAHLDPVCRDLAAKVHERERRLEISFRTWPTVTSLHADTEVRRGMAAQTRHCCASRTGHRIELSSFDYGLLRLVDAERTIADIAAAAGADAAEATAAIDSLRQRGVLSLAAPRP